MMIKEIGGIVLTYPMWWSNYDETDAVKSEAKETIDGGLVVYEQTKQDNSKYIILESKEYQWQTLAIKDQIIALANASLGATTTIKDYYDNIINVRFAHELKAVSFSRVVDIEAYKNYTGIINLARV